MALLVGAALGYAVAYGIHSLGPEHPVGAVLLNMAVFGAVIAYALQMLSYILLRHPPAGYSSVPTEARSEYAGAVLALAHRRGHPGCAFRDGSGIPKGRDRGSDLVCARAACGLRSTPATPWCWPPKSRLRYPRTSHETTRLLGVPKYAPCGCLLVRHGDAVGPGAAASERPRALAFERRGAAERSPQWEKLLYRLE